MSGSPLLNIPQRRRGNDGAWRLLDGAAPSIRTDDKQTRRSWCQRPPTCTQKKKRRVAGFGLNISASDGIVMKAGVKLWMVICPILNESSRIKHSPDVNHLWMTLVKTQLHSSSPGGLSRGAGHILIEIYFQYNCKRVWYRGTLFHDNALFARSRTNKKMCRSGKKTFLRRP